MSANLNEIKEWLTAPPEGTIFFRKLRQMVEDGQLPTFDTPWGFSEYLCQTYVPRFSANEIEEETTLIREQQQQIVEAIAEKLSRQKRYRKKDSMDLYFTAIELAEKDPKYQALAYESQKLEGPLNPEMAEIQKSLKNLARKNPRKTFKKWIKTVAPDGLYAARGLHSLFVPFLPDLWDFLTAASQVVDTESYTQNIAVASGQFTLPKLDSPLFHIAEKRPLKTKKMLDLLWEDVDDYGFGYYIQNAQTYYLYHYLKNKKLSWTKRNALKAMIDTVCGVVLIAQIPHEYVDFWGQDSESGDTMEAEIHVKPCLEECIERIFVLAAMKVPGAKPVPLRTRRKYCLSFYNIATVEDDFYGTRHLYLHPDIDCPQSTMTDMIQIQTPLQQGIQENQQLSPIERDFYKKAKWYELPIG